MSAPPANVSGQDQSNGHQHVQQTQQQSSQISSGSLDPFVCQWQGCSMRAQSPEQLYDHVCETHIGRKSTNNLNLQCMWGQCRIHVVKRDHITSHIRVHVPLKPHRCDFCGKAFKRPQDLKKHVKTHADDSVIMQTPTGRQNGMNNAPNGNTAYMPGQTKTANFFPDHQQALHSGIPVGYGQPAYQNGGSSYYGQGQPQTANSYGNVSYVSQGPEVGSQASLENVKQGLQTIRDLFPQFQAGSFDPRSYQQVEERLAAIQQYQLPFLSGPVPQAHAIELGASQAGAFGSIPQYTLPPMDNLRTKDDLLNLDQVMATMQSTIYDNASSVAAAGIAQSGAHHVVTGMGYRSSHSPTGVHLSSSHQQPMATTPPSHYDGTPALTPTSSAVSTSGNSPPSMHPHGLSPPSPPAMYPTLPGPSSDIMSGGYPSSSMAPISTLGNQYDQARRYSAGRLQRAAPPPRSEDAMDTTEDGATTPKPQPGSSSPKSEAGKTSKPKSRRGPFSSSNLDPALGGVASSPESGSGEMDENDIKANEMWVGNARTIEALRAWIQRRLERQEYDGMVTKESESESPKSREGEVSYPTLRASD